MIKSEIEDALALSIPKDLVSSLLSSYENALGQYRKENWQYFGNDIGQFIEIARRIVEYKLSGRYTLLTEQLSIFQKKYLLGMNNLQKKFLKVTELLFREFYIRCIAYGISGG